MNKRALCCLFLSVSLVLALRPPGVWAGNSEKDTAEVERVLNSVDVCKELIEIPEKGIPEALLHKSQAIAVIPGYTKAAYILGGEHGKGVILVRRQDGTWSDPVFISMTGGSVGFQIGLQRADIILVFKDRRSVDTIAQGKFKLGADASIAVGPIGRAAEASTDINFEAEVYSYSKAKGLFAGVSITGASLSIDNEADERFYGNAGLTAHQILYGTGLKAPEAAEELKDVISRYAK
jgi:lipid-binding SYLF domain-containing protein